MNPKHILWLLLLIPALAVMGCEGDQGPAGPAGADGADGADGANGTSVTVCMECHTGVGANGEPDLLPFILEYVQSGHKEGLYVDYAGGRESCARCHGKQGFLEYATTGDVSGDVPDPAAIDCATCHPVHPAAFGVRMAGPVEMIFDPTYMLDFGNSSNLCANCHQSRRAEPNIAAPADTFAITSTHYGPHHGPQANVHEGVGFAEIAGAAAYPAPGSTAHYAGACVFCHMSPYEDGTGGHTWHPSVATCANCHPGLDDFDINGIQTDTQVKLDALRDRLLALGVIEWVEEDMAYEPIVGTYPMVQAQAFFNWIGLVEDRSVGIHNPDYVNALLDNTITALENEMP